MTEIISRAEAKAAGLKNFFTGQPCIHGHIAERYTSNKACVSCQNDPLTYANLTPEQKASRLAVANLRRKGLWVPGPRAIASQLRSDARAAGQTYYFTGVPCKRGHVANRQVSGGGCVECADYRYENRTTQEKARDKASRERREARPEFIAARKEYNACPDRKARKAEQKRLANYGLLPVEFNFMLAGQGFRCAICGDDEPRGKGDWHTDHCHSTGKVRGILCHYCNVGLGNFRDAPERLQAAIEYLCKTNNSTTPTAEMAGPMKASPPIAPNAKPQPKLRLVSW